MKRILLAIALALTVLTSCTPDETEEVKPVEQSYSNCYKVDGLGYSNLQNYILVIRYDWTYNPNGLNYPKNPIKLAVSNTNDYKLGQVICDISTFKVLPQ